MSNHVCALAGDERSWHYMCSSDNTVQLEVEAEWGLTMFTHHACTLLTHTHNLYVTQAHNALLCCVRTALMGVVVGMGGCRWGSLLMNSLWWGFTCSWGQMLEATWSSEESQPCSPTPGLNPTKSLLCFIPTYCTAASMVMMMMMTSHPLHPSSLPAPHCIDYRN